MKLKENLTLQFIIFYIILVYYALAISFIFDGNFCNTNNNSNNIPSFDTIFLRYSLGAILETFFLNFLVILIFRTIPFFRKNLLWLLFLSSIPFALLHYRCIYYIFIVYPNGCSFKSILPIHLQKDGQPPYFYNIRYFITLSHQCQHLHDCHAFRENIKRAISNITLFIIKQLHP